MAVWVAIRELRNCCWKAFRGHFTLVDTRLRDASQLYRGFLRVAAVALLYGTLMGFSVQVEGLRQQVDPHWKRGLSYLKIGLRWVQFRFAKHRPLFDLCPFPSCDPQPCFASAKAYQDFYDQIWFSIIRSLRCNSA